MFNHAILTSDQNLSKGLYYRERGRRNSTSPLIEAKLFFFIIVYIILRLCRFTRISRNLPEAYLLSRGMLREARRQHGDHEEYGRRTWRQV